MSGKSRDFVFPGSARDPSPDVLTKVYLLTKPY